MGGFCHVEEFSQGGSVNYGLPYLGYNQFNSYYLPDYYLYLIFCLKNSKDFYVPLY